MTLSISLNVKHFMPSVVFLVVMLTVITLNFIMLSFIMLSVIMLSVIMINVVAPVTAMFNYTSLKAAILFCSHRLKQLSN
jgi:hypothetical protein